MGGFGDFGLFCCMGGWGVGWLFLFLVFCFFWLIG
jgi:hypothetical protein